jgi:hypothetical protein
MTALADGFSALPPPYSTPTSPHGVRPTPAVEHLVRGQVMALLESSPSYAQLGAGLREQIASDLCKIGSYSAELVREIFQRSQQLGQTPAVLTEKVSPRPEPTASALAGRAGQAPAAPPSDEFSPRAASNVARITQQTLNAIAFPTFVADLIKGTFQAIVNASIQQMEAYGALLSNVAKTVDQFMTDNISDNQARDWLVQRYPAHFTIDTADTGPTVKVRETDQPKPNFQADLGLNEDVDLSDETTESTLVPAARRKLAENRHSMLATMVLMGINRIVVTSGRIRATMGFRIDTTDTGQVHTASEFDEKNEVTTGFGGGLGAFFGGPSAEVKNTLTYVSSTKKDSTDELNVNADLTGEVDLKFKSDYFPMERFANPAMIGLIQGNTPNPAANPPVSGSASAKQTEPAAG